MDPEEGQGSMFTVLLPKSPETLDLVVPSVEIEPADQSIWSIEYPNVRNLKALPKAEAAEEADDESHTS